MIVYFPHGMLKHARKFVNCYTNGLHMNMLYGTVSDFYELGMLHK